MIAHLIGTMLGLAFVICIASLALRIAWGITKFLKDCLLLIGMSTYLVVAGPLLIIKCCLDIAKIREEKYKKLEEEPEEEPTEEIVDLYQDSRGMYVSNETGLIGWIRKELRREG